MIAFYVFGGLFSAVLALEEMNHLINDSVSPHHMHSLGHALVSSAILVALGSQLWRPARHIAGMQQLFFLALAVGASEALSARFGGLTAILLVVFAILAPLHPARRQLPHLGGARLRTLAFAGLACIPLVIYALGQAGLQRSGFDPAHASLGHWSWMAAVGLVIGLLAVLAATGPSGRRIPGYTAAAMMAAFGAGSLIFAGEPSAIPAIWALVGIVGSVAFIAVLETDHATTATLATASATPIGV
jgi:hypothetical protein